MQVLNCFFQTKLLYQKFLLCHGQDRSLSILHSEEARQYTISSSSTTKIPGGEEERKKERKKQKATIKKPNQYKPTKTKK